MSGQTKRIGVIFAGALLCAHGQWLNYPAPGTPRMRDGKPDLSAKAPRASNGKPDLSGVWQTEFTPSGENERLFGDVFEDFVVPGDDPRTFSKYFFNILADFKPGEAPIRPEGVELFRKNADTRGKGNPASQCLPQGIPRADILSYARRVYRVRNYVFDDMPAAGAYKELFLDIIPPPNARSFDIQVTSRCNPCVLERLAASELKQKLLDAERIDSARRA